MNLLKYMWRKRKFIAIVSILAMFIYYGINCFNIYYSESGTLSFIYPDSENGRYPDGTRFNIYDLMSETVLKGTVDIYNERTGNEPITLADIESSIVIDEIVPYGMHTKVQEARNSGQDYSYFANEYRISISPVNGVYKRSSKNLFGILPDIDNKMLMESLYKSYTEYFMDTHAEMNIIPKITQTMSYDGYDYIEIADVYEARVDMYITYLESKIRENGAYKSEITGKSFNDLVAEFKNLRDIKVKNLKSFVSSSKLAKNPSEFINKLKVQNESYSLYYNKLADEAEAARIAMDAYDHTYEENIIITGQNEEVGLYQAKPKTAYDTITKRALDVGVSAQAVLKDIQENERLINEYTNTFMSDETQKRLGNAADIIVAEIEEESNKLVEIADATVSDYLDSRCSDYMRFSESGKSYLSLNLIIKTLFVFLLGIFAAVIYIFLVDKDKKPGVQEITNALGIRISKRRVLLDMLIKFENYIILKRDKKLQKVLKRKKKDGAADVDEMLELNELPHGYIETFVKKRDKKRRRKMREALKKEEAKREKRKKKRNEKSVYNLEIFDKLSDVMEHEIEENKSYNVTVDEHNAFESNKKSITEILNSGVKVENDEITALLKGDNANKNSAEKDEEYILDIPKSSDNKFAPIKELNYAAKIRCTEKDIKDSRDFQISDIISRDLKINDTVDDISELKQEIKEIGKTNKLLTGFEDDKSNLSSVSSFGILGDMRDKLDEILASGNSIIDELLNESTDDLAGEIKDSAKKG